MLRAHCRDYRGLAYEAVGLYLERLPREDFREQPQLEGLLQTLRRSLAVPFQRLPAVVALFLAEAALQLQHPGGPMYVLLNKLLLKRPTFNLEVSFSPRSQFDPTNCKHRDQSNPKS